MAHIELTFEQTFSLVQKAGSINYHSSKYITCISQAAKDNNYFINITFKISPSIAQSS